MNDELLINRSAFIIILYYSLAPRPWLIVGEFGVVQRT